MNRSYKVTKSCFISNIDKIVFLMDQIGFKEIDRVLYGSDSGDRAILTFEGDPVTYNEDSHYIVKDSRNSKVIKEYFSLRIPDGYSTSKIESFKRAHNGMVEDRGVVMRFKTFKK